MSESWISLRQRFIQVVFRRSVDEVAQRIPAHRATVYRIIQNERHTPSLAVRAGIRKILDDPSSQP